MVWSGSGGAAALLEQWSQMQQEALRHILAPRPEAAGEQAQAEADGQEWARSAARLNRLVLEFQAEQLAAVDPAVRGFDPQPYLDLVQGWCKQMPFADPDVQRRLWSDGVELWDSIVTRARAGPAGAGAPLPREDPRFADPLWRQEPFFAALHQTYLMLAEQIMLLAGNVPGLDPVKREQLRLATRLLVEALSPAHLPLTNPVVIERTLATKGDSLVRGMEHLLTDLRQGQLTQSDPKAFEVGRNLAITPGKVVHETPLYQVIQYSPVTTQVLAVPLVIFPPWINRFYILDLRPETSMVRWLLEQGVTVFMVSWKSADADLGEVFRDDYAVAQIEVIDHVRDRLGVPAVHVLGYCVSGTTLAATLAVLARRGMGGKVRSATFLTTQVDFEKAGELRLLVDDGKLAAMEALAADGTIDGRCLAATFNLLRAPDLIWQYVINHYLLGESYRAFDLLHWNGDTANLAWGWLKPFLLEHYRDNRLVQPGALEIDGTPVDLSLIETPAYVQAGRDDHIAPPGSVWRLTGHLRGPVRFVLSGSGHIAGVVNPPSRGKYGYRVNPQRCGSLDEFLAGSDERPGSWWPDWIEWLREVDGATVRSIGKRRPGGRGDRVIEDAPGRYVLMR